MIKDLSQIAENLHFKNGIWETESQSVVSFPAEDHSKIEAFENESFWFQYRLKILTSFLLKNNRGARILDIGGGGGLTSLALQNLGFDVVLLEPTIDGVAAAKKKGVSAIAHSTLLEAGFKDGSFDCALICDVLEHVEEEEPFLNEIKRVLVKGGQLYITVPAFKTLWSQSDTDAGHFRRYNSTSLTRVVEKTGFKMDYGTYFFSPLLIPLLLFRSLPWLLGKRTSIPPESYTAHHKAGNKVARSVLEFLLNLEHRILKRKIKIPFGTSCFAIVRNSN